MKFNFKKIASVLAGAVMATSTVAFAAAANYPAPFVKNGNADVAVVYGSWPGADVDLAAVSDITQNLQYALAKQTAGGSTTSGGVSTSVQGEAVPLFSSAKKIYVNSTLDSAKTTLDKSDLPTLLADSSISGNVDAKITQTIKLGSTPQLIYGKEPTSDNDPKYVLWYGGAAYNYWVYNATASFSKAVAFDSSDTKGTDLTLFGQKFTVASSTDSTYLVLFKSAEKVSLTSDDPSAKVSVGDKEYTIELVSASDTSGATIKVTDPDGNSETKEINEYAIKKVSGVNIAVTTADETNLKLSASVIVGAEKITLKDGSTVKVGEEDKTVQGTIVNLKGGVSALTELTVSVFAKDSDVDAIREGGTLVDPVFGTFKLDFSGMSIPENSTARENIVVAPSGDDKMTVRFTPYGASDPVSVQWAKNTSAAMYLQGDDSGRKITVIEGERIYRNGFVVVGNEETGRILKLTSIENDADSYTSDYVEFVDVLSGETIKSKQPTAEGTATVTVASRDYTVRYYDTGSSDTNYIVLDYPESTGSGDVIVYPTIKTSKGAKLAFYEPLTINLSDWDGRGTNVANLKFPDGDGYTDFAVTRNSEVSYTINSVTFDTVEAASTEEANLTVGSLVYSIRSAGGANTTNVTLYLREPDTSPAVITDPALVIWEEKDDLARYNALVVTLETGATGDDGMGVNSVIRTWHNDANATWDAISMASDSKKTKEADYYGTIALIDGSDSDQKSATISYPDEQVYANLYMSAKSAEITSSEEEGTATGTGVKSLGYVTIRDTEVSQASSKNLIVVGGSCVNKLAAELLTNKQEQVCGTEFEKLTGVGAGSFLIQTFSRTGGKVATLVAGYHAADTVNAAKYLTTQTVDTTVGKKYKGTAADKAELVTTTTTTA